MVTQEGQKSGRGPCDEGLYVFAYFLFVVNEGF